jgi:DNA-binding transcriptional regulator of glucitol operon
MDRWISIRESQTAGFIIVCECNNIFRVKTIEKIVLRYKDRKVKRVAVEEKKDDAPLELVKEIVETKLEEEKLELQIEDKIQVIEEVKEVEEIIEKPIIPDHLLQSSCDVLVNYGFTVTEAKDLIRQTYSNNPVDSVGTIVTNCLKNLKIGDNEDVAINETDSL